MNILLFSKEGYFAICSVDSCYADCICTPHTHQLLDWIKSKHLSLSSFKLFVPTPLSSVSSIPVDDENILKSMISEVFNDEI